MHVVKDDCRPVLPNKKIEPRVGLIAIEVGPSRIIGPHPARITDPKPYIAPTIRRCKTPPKINMIYPTV